MLFVRLRRKKAPTTPSKSTGLFLFLLLVQSTLSMDLYGASEADKRAAFMGMRGRRSQTDDDPGWNQQQQWHEEDPLEEGKRSAFMGMRGKKSYLSPAEEDYLVERLIEEGVAGQQQQQLKRAGFMGMRGKKSDEDVNDFGIINKRAGFVGMRGKKRFQGLRRKMRGSGFVGMRG